MMNLDDYRFKLRDKNSRFKDRLFKDHVTSDLVETGGLFLSLAKPDIEIATLIDHELRKRKSLERTSENGEEVQNESNSNLNYLLTQSKKLAHIVYRKCAFIIKLLDQIVEAIMVRTIYRLSDRQKNVIMNILIFVGVGVVNELTR